MREVDKLIHAAWIAPVEPAGVLLEGHCVAVRGGRIEAVLPSAEAATAFSAAAEVRLDRHLLVPGLVNLHGHAAMALLRGIADDLPLMAWLKDHVWPAEARHVGDEFVHDGSLLAAVEMLRGGTTCFNDMYFFPEATARAALRAGIRASLGIIAVEFPSAYAADAAGYLHKGLAVRDAYRQTKKIAILPFTVNSSENINYIRDGIWDMLISRVTVSGKTDVLSKSSVLEVMGTKKDITQADVLAFGKRLKADFVVRGSITKIGESLTWTESCSTWPRASHRSLSTSRPEG